MDEKRRQEIARLIERFYKNPISQDAINEFCQRNSIKEVVMVGELKDYIAQVEHDKRVIAILPKMLLEVQKLRYVPEFSMEKTRKEIIEQNDEVRINITKILEEHNVPYRFVQTMCSDLGSLVGGTISSAGKTAFNKALEVMMLVTARHFGEDEFHMGHAAKFAVDLFDKAEKEKEGK